MAASSEAASSKITPSFLQIRRLALDNTSSEAGSFLLARRQLRRTGLGEGFLLFLGGTGPAAGRASCSRPGVTASATLWRKSASEGEPARVAAVAATSATTAGARGGAAGSWGTMSGITTGEGGGAAVRTTGAGGSTSGVGSGSRITGTRIGEGAGGGAGASGGAGAGGGAGTTGGRSASAEASGSGSITGTTGGGGRAASEEREDSATEGDGARVEASWAETSRWRPRAPEQPNLMKTEGCTCLTMAVGAMDTAGGEEHRYGGRITGVVVMSCATAAMAGAIFGCDLGASGGVSSMEPFLREFFPGVYRRMKSGGGGGVSNYCKFDSQLLTLFTSSLYISGLLTAMLLASWVTATRGRRPSMIIGAIACLAGAAIGSGAVNLYMAILGRALLGVGLGFANQVVNLSEMAPARFRGAFSNGFQLSLCLGSLAATVVNYGAEKITAGWGWRLSLALAGVPSILLAVGAIFLPETPNSLVQQGKPRGEVKALLQKIRGVEAVDDELDDIVAAAASSSSRADNNGMRLLVTQRRYRPQLAMAILIPAFTQLTGINAVGFYAPELLRTIGMGESASLLCTVVTVVVFTTSTLVFMCFIDRFGRRALLLAGGVQMLLSEALIGVIMAAKLGDEGGLSRQYALALFVLIGVYVAGYSWSWGPLTWLVPSEIFPLEVRSAGQSVTVASGFVFTIFIAQCFLAMLCRMKAWLFFFFAGWIAVMTAFAYLFLPETKGMPIEQIGKVWQEHWFWKRVVGVEEVQVGEKL